MINKGRSPDILNFAYRTSFRQLSGNEYQIKNTIPAVIEINYQKL